jgi:hypothetical protein
VFDEFIIAIYIFTADDNRICLGKRSFSVCPFAGRNKAIGIPLTHPTLRCYAKKFG